MPDKVQAFQGTRVERMLNIRNKKGNIVHIVREHYLRSDTPCPFKTCPHCEKSRSRGGSQQVVNQITGQRKTVFPQSTVYVLDPSAGKYFYELFEEVSNLTPGGKRPIIVVLQSTFQIFQELGYSRSESQLRRIIEDSNSSLVLFDNEHNINTFAVREPAKETAKDRDTRAALVAASYLGEHLYDTLQQKGAEDNEVPTVRIVSCSASSQHVYSEHGCETIGMEDLLCEAFGYDYLNQPDTLAILDGLQGAMMADIRKEENPALAARGDTEKHPFAAHTALEMAQNLLASGKVMYGRFQRAEGRHMSKGQGQETYGFVRVTKPVQTTLRVPNLKCANRAMHNDVVYVELMKKYEEDAAEVDGAIIDVDEEIGDYPLDDAGLLLAADDKGLLNAKVIAIDSRAWKDYVCSLRVQDDGSVVPGSQQVAVPADRNIPCIRFSTRQADKLASQRFVVRIDRWDAEFKMPDGHYVKTLGDIGDLTTDLRGLLIEHDVAIRPFSEEQMAELPGNDWTIHNDSESSPLERRDLRETHTVMSIDPIGSQDVDDALSIREMQRGQVIELGVHIADVSHFVRTGSANDREASQRSTTVYLPDRRFNMLPEQLSENLCSLQGGEERFAVSVLWRFRLPDFRVQNVWMGRTALKNRYKMSYEVAQSIMDYAGDPGMDLKDNLSDRKNILGSIGDCPAALLKASTSEYQTVLSSIQWAFRIAEHFRQLRLDNGALELESDAELQIRIDRTTGQVTGMTPKQGLPIHKVIAELMILANRQVAEYLTEQVPNLAVLRRHALPDANGFQTLARLAASKGFSINHESNKALATSLSDCDDRSEPMFRSILRQMAVRAMSEAEYICIGADPTGDYSHYGLGLDLYTHFTSPIRRYADVVVHRLLLACLGDKRMIRDVDSYDSGRLGALCRHINDRHRASKVSQREATRLFLLDYLRRLSVQQRVVEGLVIDIQAVNGIMIYLPAFSLGANVPLQSLLTKPSDNEQGSHFMASVFNLSDTQATARHVRETFASMKGDGDLSELCLKTSDLGSELIGEGHDNYSVRITRHDKKHSQTCRLFQRVTVLVDLASSRAHRTKINLYVVSLCGMQTLDRKGPADEHRFGKSVTGSVGRLADEAEKATSLPKGNKKQSSDAEREQDHTDVFRLLSQFRGLSMRL
eukprot:Clim_evm11s171 gene=Clim_evmTU11s171